MGLWRKYKSGLQAREFPWTIGLVGCLVLSSFAGFHEYGFTSSLNAFVLNSLDLNSYDAIPTSMAVSGLPYVLFSFPLSYYLGHRFGYKAALMVGFACMYLYGMYGVIVYTIPETAHIWKTRGIPVFMGALILFGLSIPIINYNLYLLALEQVPLISNEGKSVVLHWVQIFFFAGQSVGTFIGPLMFEMIAPQHTFSVKVGTAVLGLLILMWLPMQTYYQSKKQHPFRKIWKILQAAAKECPCCKSRRRSRESVTDHDRSLLVRRNRLLYSARNKYPNCFERTTIPFGGDLLADEVRDVQKFGLIVLILLCFLGAFMVQSLLTSAYTAQALRMRFPDYAINASRTVTYETHPNITNSTNVTIHAVWQPVSWIATAIPFTSLVTLIAVDRVIYPLCGLVIHLRMRIGLGLLFALLSALIAMVVEIVRKNSYTMDNDQVTMVNQFALIANSVATYWPTADLSVLWTVLQFIFFGVGNALFLVGGLELVCIAAPQFTQPFSLVLYAFLNGVAFLFSSALVASQRVETGWSFYYGPEPTNGLSAYGMICGLSLALCLAYWVIARIYSCLELVVIKPYNDKILGKEDFPKRQDPSSVINSGSINYRSPK